MTNTVFIYEAGVKLSVKDLSRGIELWYAHPNWPRDFHSRLYLDLKQLVGNELTSSNWNKLVDILWNWRAIRGGKGITKQFIRERGAKSLPELNNDIDIFTRNRTFTPSINDLNWTWAEISHLFQTALKIKGVPSPVFASKLCHFLLPDLFPVIDRDYIGLSGNYADYWMLCANLWRKADEGLKIELKNKLGKYTLPETKSFFPWATKIVEICLSGHSKT